MQFLRGDRVQCISEQPEYDLLHGLVGTVVRLHGDAGYDNGLRGTKDVWVEWAENSKHPWPCWAPVELLRKV